MKKYLPVLSSLIAMSSLMAMEKKESPPMDKGVRVGVYTQYLAMQPNGSSLYYGAEAFPFDTGIAIPAASPNWKILEIDPSYHFAFDVGVGILLDNVGISLCTDWMWLHTHDEDSTYVSDTHDMVGPIFDIGPQSSEYKSAKGAASYHFDQVNFDCGKELVFGKWHTNVYGGAAFLRLKESIHSTFYNDSTNIGRIVRAASTFTGAGPQMGIDYDYKICNHLFFVGNSIVSLFMGQLQNHTTFKSYTPELTDLDLPNPNVQKTTVPNRTQLVPGLEQKLGFSYVIPCKKIAVSIGIGYQCQIYLNAIQSMDMTSPQVLPEGATFTSDAGVYAVGFERTLSNFILTGPYGSLNAQF